MSAFLAAHPLIELALAIWGLIWLMACAGLLAWAGIGRWRDWSCDIDLTLLHARHRREEAAARRLVIMSASCAAATTPRAEAEIVAFPGPRNGGPTRQSRPC